MLRPTSLTTSQYGLATKPALGYEEQLFFTTQQAVNPGSFLGAGVNSGVYTANVADTAALAATPMEMLCILNTEVRDAATVVLTVTGTDASNNPLTGTATFAPPAYSQEQNIVYPKGWAVEIIPGTVGALWKTITNIAIVSGATVQYAQFLLMGVPSISSYKKIGLKVKLNYDPKAPMPTAVQDGRDLGAFIKAGNIDIGTLSITSKSAVDSDGLQRYNGIRGTGLVKQVKEDQLNTMNVFMTGLIITVKRDVPEDQSPLTLEATGMYEKIGFVLAGGAGQP